MALAPAHVEHLVAASLTVNGYPIERAVALIPAFRERGLLDVATVGAMDGAELAAAIVQAGYARGGYVPIVTYRLAQLLTAAASPALDQLPAFVVSRNEQSFTATLRTVHGFGPATAATAWFLWSGG